MSIADDPMKFHPACAIFPELEGDEYKSLVEDIRIHGLREPILLDASGAILDGRNRYRACREAGITPRSEVWKPKNGDSPLALVVSLNIKRRHLNASLRSVLADRLEPMFAEEAKKRKQEAGRTHGRGKVTQKIEEAIDKNTNLAAAQAAKVTGANRQYVSDVKALRTRAPALYEQVASGKLTVPEAKEEVRREAKAAVVEKIRREPEPLPAGPFRVIVADPPWRYEARAEDMTHRARSPYPDMSVEEICAMDIGGRAAADSVLWLWTTNAFMRQAFQVLDAWGFAEKTILTWVKDRIGAGIWLRGQTEHCLLAIRGKPVIQLTNQSTALHAARTEHSTKPDEFYALVESLCPGSRLAVFERKERPGWRCWGAELE